eukprot:CAMPEP_0181204022 /NCGR_PEP_ID=MMETSP1096-20121128/19707_1 /TAXON_ID=156174 ORGANISM="Chrysochromulina ericina, Strain CCMP281" /NCGR_SAMPLE_ID=MMETSP1096 /ASSEMBLY_ACC=CAM_ASM_000453 /LENGTH=107 /DNA_ID=CAMNT_0023294681 /DNA_START=204 /DNA_END=527 /DNA_ORIENTATION=-
MLPALYVCEEPAPVPVWLHWQVCDAHLHRLQELEASFVSRVKPHLRAEGIRRLEVHLDPSNLHIRDACHFRELEALRDRPADAPLARREAAIVCAVVDGVEFQSNAV